MAPDRILSMLGVTNVITVNCDDTVEQALHLIDEKQVRAVPVGDSNNVFKGMFSSHEIIKALVPSYMTQGIATLDFATGASSVLGRLRKCIHHALVIMCLAMIVSKSRINPNVEALVCYKMRVTSSNC